MFIRKTKSGKNTYLQVVESKRVNGKSVHQVLYNLGKVDENGQLLNKQFLADLADQLKIATNDLSKEEFHSLKEIQCGTSKIFNYGFAIYEEIFQSLGLLQLLTNIKNKNSRLKMDLVNAVLLMVFERFFEPSSKLSAFEHQSRYWKKENIELHHLYRALDILADNKETIEKLLFKKNHGFGKINLVFYDVTTYAFESVDADSLRDFGYSKDCKFKEVQVVMGLAIGENGLPIGYELFKGSTCETKTMHDVIESLKQKFGENCEVTIVADGGLNSKTNLVEIVENNFGYVVSMRIKSMTKVLKECMFEESGYQQISKENEIFRYKEVLQTRVINGTTLEEKIIFTYSEKRARKDEKDRKRLLEKAENLVEKPESIKALNKRGGKKYLKEIGTSTFELDEEAVKRDAQFDGYRGIITNTKMTGEDVLSKYHDLWKIEESFRILKTTLEARPVFHYTEKRIKGHFVLCYITLVITRLLENRMKESLSIEQWRDAIRRMNVIETSLNGITSYSTSEDDSNMRKVKEVIPVKINNRNRIVVSW